MNTIVEQVRAGLEEKVKGLQTTLMYVKDPREIDRLTKDLNGAIEALEKLNAEDTRTPEELAELEQLIDSSVDVEGAAWDDLTPIEKFAYRVREYYDTLNTTLENAKSNRNSVFKVISFISKHKGDSDLYLKPVLNQFGNSLNEIDFSISQIEEQLSYQDAVFSLLTDDEFFEKLDLINRFLNNPMSLPHLTDEFNKKREALQQHA